MDAAERLDRYADLIVRVGANVQPGQPVFVNALVEHADLARALTRSAYAAGSPYVDVRYGDQHVQKAMIALAPEEVLTETPPWLLERMQHVADGGARIMRAGEAEPERMAGVGREGLGKAPP